MSWHDLNHNVSYLLFEWNGHYSIKNELSLDSTSKTVKLKEYYVQNGRTTFYFENEVCVEKCDKSRIN